MSLPNASHCWRIPDELWATATNPPTTFYDSSTAKRTAFCATSYQEYQEEDSYRYMGMRRWTASKGKRTLMLVSSTRSPLW